MMYMPDIANPDKGTTVPGLWVFYVDYIKQFRKNLTSGIFFVLIPVSRE